MSGISGGGGWRAGLQTLLQKGQEALNKVRGDKKEEVKGEGKAGSTGGSTGPGGASAAKGKGKTKGAGSSNVERLMAGENDFSVEDEDKERRRKQRFFLGNDDAPRDFVVQDATAEKSAVAHISAEFRGQVASGMTAGRSFTQGSCIVPDGTDMEDDADDEPKKKTKRR